MKHALVIAALTAAAAAGCAKAAPSHPQPPPIAVPVAHVERRTLANVEELDGQIDPYLEANLAPQQTGTLVAVYANEGDRVHRGETLAKIDDSTLRADLDQQVGNQVQASAKLAQSQIQLPITATSVRDSLVQAQKALVQARQQLVTDRANVANTRETYEGDRQLLQPGFVARTTYQGALAAYIAAQQTEHSDEEKVVQESAAVDAARRNLLNTPLQERVIQQNEGSLEQARGSVEQYRTAISQTVITAPFDGVVTSRTIDPGAFAGPNQAIYQVAQIDPVYVDFNAKDVDLRRVQPGTLVSFTASGDPGRRYDGRVASVDALPSNGTLLYRARIVERNPDYALRGGELVTVRITKQSRPNVLAVPRSAVTLDGDRGTIYTIAASHAGGDTPHRDAVRAQHVRIGLQTNVYVEVSGGGVRPGEAIVAAVPDGLHDGAIVSQR